MLRLGFTIFLTFLNVIWITYFIRFRMHPIQHTPQFELKIQNDAFDIQTIEFQKRTDKTHWQFENINHRWMLKSPIVWEANPLAISDFLQQITSLKPQLSFKVDPHTDLNAYGLSVPFLKLKCSTPEHTYLLQFGSPSQANGKVYILEVETNKIFITDANFLNCLNLSTEQWCTPTIFPINTLQNISFVTPTQKLYLNYNQGIWHLKIPTEIQANQQHVITICHQLIQLECLRFLSSSDVKNWLIPFSQDSNLYYLTLTNDKGSYTLKFLPYDEDQHLFVAQRNNEGPLFLFQSTFVERLLNPQETLRERTLFHIDLKQVKKIVYSNQAEQLVLQPITKNKWEILQNKNNNFIQAQKASLKHIEHFINSINDIYVENFIQDPIDLDQSKCFKLELHNESNTTLATFYSLKDNFYVKFDNEPTLFQLTTFNEKLFTQSIENFQDKTVWAWNTDERISNVTLSIPNEKKQIPVHLNQFDEKLLSQLTVKKWVDRDLKYPIFNPKYYILEIETTDSSNIVRTYTLQFLERINGNTQSGQYLSKKFILPQPWIDFLFRLTHLPYWNELSQKFHKNL